MRFRGLVLAGSCLLFLAGVWTLAEPLETSKPPESVRDLVYWGAGGPVRVRLHLQIDGQAVETVWSKAIDALFAYADRNGDGILEGAELTPFTESRNQNQQVNIDPDGNQPAVRLVFEDRRAKVTRPEFEKALRTAGLEPLSFIVTKSQPNSQRLSSILFQRLDMNGDGKLSRAELLDARSRLEFFDANEDEFISVAELLSRTETNIVRPLPRRGVAPADSSNDSSDLTVLPGNIQEAVQQILSARSDGKNKFIRRADFGSDPSTFAALDKNGDGRLDAVELAAWLERPPGLDLRFSIDSNQATKPGAIVSSGDDPNVRVQTAATGEIDSVWPKLRLQFNPPADTESENAAWKKKETQIRARLGAFKDKAGSLKGQGQTNQNALTSFLEFASRKAESMPSAPELESAFRVLGQLAGCKMVISARDNGTGLFELLDRNGDGQLSPRELVESLEILKPFADAKGLVGPGELPRRFSIAVNPGSIPIVFSILPVPVVKRQPSVQSIPDWFANMDRNGDGEISLREFLGPIELFRKLDKNGDGLISPDEVRGARLAK